MWKRPWLRIDAPEFWASEKIAEEVSRVCRQIDFLEDENKELCRRLAFLGQDLRQAQAKVTTALINLQGLLDRVKAMEASMRDDPEHLRQEGHTNAPQIAGQLEV